jgi:hypothetical protein
LISEANFATTVSLFGDATTREKMGENLQTSLPHESYDVWLHHMASFSFSQLADHIVTHPSLIVNTSLIGP